MHLRKGLEDLLLDSQGRQGRIRQRLEPLLDGRQQIRILHGRLQRVSAGGSDECVDQIKNARETNVLKAAMSS